MDMKRTSDGISGAFGYSFKTVNVDILKTSLSESIQRGTEDANEDLQDDPGMRFYLRNRVDTIWQKEAFHKCRTGFLQSVDAACCNSSARRRKSTGAMCSLSVYSAFIRHPVAQPAF